MPRKVIIDVDERLAETLKNTFYYGTFKKVIGGFGALFSNFHVVRRKGDISQDILVPISYGPKEKWVQMFTSDPAQATQTNVTLPRMSYEIIGYTYDTARKTTRSATITCKSTSGSTYVLTPAPWNLELSLYIVGNKQEDVFQILEQILPRFNPDYTLKIKSIPQLNLVTDVPIALTSVSPQDDWMGDYISHRIIIYTLTFTCKTEIYGKLSNSSIILDSEINVGAETIVSTSDEEGNITTSIINNPDGETIIYGSENYGGVDMVGYEVNEPQLD